MWQKELVKDSYDLEGMFEVNYIEFMIWYDVFKVENYVFIFWEEFVVYC